MKIGNVSPVAVHVPIHETTQPFAFGMEPFNASVASQLGVMGDMLLNLNYANFLFNPLHAIDLGHTTTADKGGCVKGIALKAEDSCTRHFMITQELLIVEANLPLTQRLDSNIVLSANQQVYSLEYHDNIDVARDELQCETFRSGPASYRLCVGTTEEGLHTHDQNP
jgi:hypothetical protein